MLTITRGTLTTARSAAGTSGHTRTYRFVGSDAEALGGGRMRFRLEAEPSEILTVDYDGLQLFEDLDRGFIWETGPTVVLSLPPQQCSNAAIIHIRVRN